MTIRKAAACSLILFAAGCTREKPVRLATFQGALEPYLAREIGAYRDEGATVEITAVSGTAKAMEALLAGSADAVLGTFEQSIQLRRQGKPVEVLAVLDTCHCLALVSKNRDLRSPADLAGKTIGVAAPGGQMQNFARFLLRGAEASYVAIGAGPSAAAAVESGKVDAAVVLYTNYVTLRQRDPQLNVLAETFTRDGMRQWLGIEAYASKSLLASPEWSRAHPDAAAKLKRAMLRTVRWMKANPAETILDRLPAEVRGPDRATDLTLLRLLVPLLSETGAVPPGADAAVSRLLP